MKLSIAFISLITFALSISPSFAQSTKPEPGGEKVNDPALQDVPDIDGLPRVMLIGDSISMGYTIPVRKLLDGKANVHRPANNAGPTTNGLTNLDSWLAMGSPDGAHPKKWDVIHFNFGLHDLKIMSNGPSGPVRQVPPDEYEKNLRELVRRLRATGAKLVWASTTPIPDGTLRPPRTASDVLKYNEIAARVMKDNDIPTDDLYALVLPKQKEIQVKGNVHFSKRGYELLAAQVAASVQKVLADQ